MFSRSVRVLFTICFTLAISHASFAQTISFSSAPAVSVGTNPSAVAISDFNGDGKLDLAVANLNSNNISILTGAGNGTFNLFTTISGTGGSYSVGSGDFNGDGKQDLAVANYNNPDSSPGNTVSIFLGDGTGLFGAAANFGVGSYPNFVAVADLNGDGISDLAVANTLSNDVSILIGTGLGSFSAAVNSPAGSGPGSVAIADFNGDAFPDLAVANSYSTTVSTLLGTGGGAFSAPSPFSAGTAPVDVAIADFNSDGALDLAVSNTSSNNVSILLGNGTGSFGPPINTLAGANPFRLAVGDLNSDGRPDLAVVNVTSNNVSILAGTGTGSFNATSVTVGTTPYSVAIGDFNGDGKPDLAVANHLDNNVSVLINTTPTVTEALLSLASMVQSYNLKQGIASSFDAKIQNAFDALYAAHSGASVEAANKLLAFINSVEAQRGKQLTNAQADALEASAHQILAMI